MMRRLNTFIDLHVPIYTAKSATTTYIIGLLQLNISLHSKYFEHVNSYNHGGESSIKLEVIFTGLPSPPVFSPLLFMECQL